MLSYQHSYHAGNMADVHKHAMLAWMLDYLTRKDKPLTYLETHAGRGLYDLTADESIKTQEAERGIVIVEAGKWFTADDPYSRVLDMTRGRYGATSYPGSPLIAAQMLRPDDSIHLAELHPQEHAALQDVMVDYSAIAHKVDGLAMALGRTPPMPRRGLMLMDPSFEVKTDYDALPTLIQNVHKKWNVGILMLWYPILAKQPHLGMLRQLQAMNLPGAIRHEVSFPPARPGHGMTGSGLFIVNPPFGTADRAANLSKVFDRDLKRGR